MEYKGFEIYTDAFGAYWAKAGGGAIVLGPFEDEREARFAIDQELEWRP